MVFEATYLRELSSATGSLTFPHFVHPVGVRVPHVGDYIVLCLLGCEFLRHLRLLDGHASG